MSYIGSIMTWQVTRRSKCRVWMSRFPGVMPGGRVSCRYSHGLCVLCTHVLWWSTVSLGKIQLKVLEEEADTEDDESKLWHWIMVESVLRPRSPDPSTSPYLRYPRLDSEPCIATNWILPEGGSYIDFFLVSQKIWKFCFYCPLVCYVRNSMMAKNTMHMPSLKIPCGSKC